MRAHARRFRNYIFLIPLFALVLLYQITYTIEVIRVSAAGTRIATVPFAYDGTAVQGMSAEAANAGLHIGDRVVTIDGRPLTSERILHEAIRAHKPHELLSLEVVPQGGGVRRAVQVPLPAKDGRPMSLQDWAATLAINLALLFCALMGIYVAAILPYDLKALIFFGLMTATSQIVTSARWYDFPRPLWSFALIFNFVGIFSWPVWMACFALYLPHRFRWDVQRPWIKWTFLGPLIAWSVLYTAGASSGFYGYHALAWLGPISKILNGNVILAAAITFFFGAIGTKRGSAKNKDERRRLQILLAGSIAGLVPVGLLVLYITVTQANQFNQPSQAVFIPICLLFCLFPATLAYVVVAERAMSLRMVIRQSVRYGLARGGAALIPGLLAFAILIWLAPLVFGSGYGLEVKIPVYVGGVILVTTVVRKSRRRLLAWVDRRFFREAYNAQMLLEDLSESVRSIIDEEHLLDTVARRISESLHVSHFAVLLNGDGALRPVYCLGLHPTPQVALPENSKVVEVVKQAKQPPQIYFDHKDNWIHSAPESELVTLKAIGAQLLLPIGGKEKLMGMFSLGPKLSETPYSQSDVHLLRSVALQTGLALENSRLTKTIAREMAQREKLNREIEIAREVQERLFPQRLPVVAGIDCYGACRPALGVGGDYYDFLTLPDGDLGIAIGDVSGKGIAAALLMASLQASLRGQALMGHGDLARLMTNVNQLIFDATPINRYATFFYGQYHRETRVFTYVNAGHNPPIVLRRTSDGAIHVIRLETGGPVVGLFPNAPYQQGSLVMEPGDIFVGFTDGISEAMNQEEEEWGEQRLIPAIAEQAEKSASEMIPALMAEADRFVSGAPQHDDMTLVVMKMCAA